MKPSPQSGFSLLEMTVVIGIISTLLGSYLAFYKPTQDARATAETKRKIEKILDSVASYTLRHNRLPCPSFVGNATITGREGFDGSNCDGNTRDSGGRRMHSGIVPYSTLGLSQEDAKDGFGRYMTYRVWRNAASATHVLADNNGSIFCNNDETNIIELYRNNRDQSQSGNPAIRPVVVVISHGPEGIGGYNMSAASTSNRGNPLGNLSSLGGDTSRGERRNAVDRPLDRLDIDNYSTQTGNSHFDDVIGYMTKRGVITRLGVTYCGAGS